MSTRRRYNRNARRKSKKRHYDSDGHRLRKKHWHNEHHLLFPRTDWNRSVFGRKLRNHKYFRKYIPENTLHEQIHSKMIAIPLPPEDACEAAYYELLRLCNENLVNVHTDTLERRLQLLIDLWHDYPATVGKLKMQQRIAIKFYKNGRM